MLAACHHLTQERNGYQFRRHLLVHVPEMQARLQGNKPGEKGRLFLQRAFSRVQYARYEELFLIHKTLADADRRRIVVLRGDGGMGKTQLATTYAECYGAITLDIFRQDIKDLSKMTI